MLVRKILVVIIVLNVVLALFVFEGSAASAKGIASDVVLPNNNQIVDDNSGQCPATNAGSITPLNEGVTDLLLKVAQESEVFQLFVEELNSYNKVLYAMFLNHPEKDGIATARALWLKRTS